MGSPYPTRGSFGAFEKGPSAIHKDVPLSGGFELGHFHATDLINGLPELPHNVEAVQDIQGLRGFFGNDLQIRWPHIATDELELGRPLLSEHAEEAKKGLGSPLIAAPEKPSGSGIELVDHGEVLVAFEDGNLVSSLTRRFFKNSSSLKNRSYLQ